MKGDRCAVLLLALAATGCHVIERAERCSEVASLIDKARPELEATKIPDDPEAKVIRKKARLYGQLASKIEKVPFKNPHVKAERDGLVTSLHNVEKYLLDAAQAVDEQEKLDERVQKHTAQERSAPPAPEQADDKSTASKEPTAPTKGATAEKPTDPKLPNFAKRPPRIGSPQHPKRAPSARSTVHSRRYTRAKRAVESASHVVAGATRKLEKVCR